MTPVSYEIVSVELADSKIVVIWSDALQQDIHSAYLRHSPGFPGSERPAGPGGRFTSAAGVLTPAQARITASGDLQLDWQCIC